MSLGNRPQLLGLLRVASLAIAYGLVSEYAAAQPPEHADGVSGLAQRIDAIIDEDPTWMQGDMLPDSLLLRRLSLDLRNVVPTQEEVEAFLADSAEDRWSRWIDRFQRDPLASERWVDWYDKTLMQRRPFQHADRAAWLAMLRQSVDQRRSLDAMLRDMVTSAWWNRSQRAQQRFFLDRGGDPHAIARDLGRVFFGRDMQCAQCHDHPQIDDYLQIDYHGLLAFVASSAMAEGTTKDDKGADQKVQLYIERAAGDAPFESVFDKGVKYRSATRVPGATENFEPYLAPDQRYQPQPNPDTFLGIGAPPVASRRAILASHLHGGNRAFAENWANRLWAILFGRGIVHPLDMHHSDNPPSNPRLLAAVTDALIASQFDAPAILAELAKSRAYRRGHRIPLDTFRDAEQVVIAAPEQVAQWMDQLQSLVSSASAEKARIADLEIAKQAARDQARDAWRGIQQERLGLRGELDAAEAAFNEAQKKLGEAQKGLDQAAAAEQSSSAKIALLEDAAQKLEQAKSGPEDPELAPAIAAAKTRAEQMKANLPTLQQAVASATAARDAALAAREGERNKWQAVVDKLAPVEQRLQDADRALVQARREHDACRAESSIQQRRIAQAERFLQWFKVSSEIAALRAQGNQWNQEHADGLPMLASYQAMVDGAESAVVAAQSKLSQQDERIAASAKEIAAIEAQLAQLQSAKQSLSDSASLVADASAFAAASAELDRSREARLSRLAEAKSNGAGMSQQRISLAAEMETATRNRDQARAQWNAWDRHLEQLVAQRDRVRSDLDARIKQCSEIRSMVGTDREHQHAIAAERPLSPEQLAWSILRSTNVLQNYIANEHAELNKQGELPADATEAQRSERELRAVRGAIDKLQGNVDTFSSLYSSGVGQTSDEFFASPDQALYFANGGAVYSWASPSSANVSSRLVQATDPEAVARSLYLALLSREPSPSERQFIIEQCTSAGDQRPAIVQELVWSILAGAEYRVYP